MWVYTRNLVADGGFTGFIFEEVAVPNEQFWYNPLLVGITGILNISKLIPTKPFTKSLLKGYILIVSRGGTLDCNSTY